LEQAPTSLLVFAPAGIGEIVPGAPLADLIAAAVAADPHGPLRAGDVVVVTSKIVSKAEGRLLAAPDRAAGIAAETVRTVARAGETVIARTRAGLTLAAAGVDASNVPAGEVLLLPGDADASARRLRTELQALTGARLGVIISDTAGRAWRRGQTDLAIGAAGVTTSRDYAGQRDDYGNELRVTERALADELAAAADLVKGKLAGRPVAVVRGLDAGGDETSRAAELIRDPSEDLFAYGSREAVLAALLVVTGQADRYEELVALAPAERPPALLAGADLSAEAADLVRALLAVDHARLAGTPSNPG
jgi:coenzyme F420-0:L-glutamate ligase/coenzyme F420-1:gamma-L-glutamate ligase